MEPRAEAAAIPRRTGYVEHDGERIYFEAVGAGGVPLVLCHGAGGNHAVWYQQVAPFARRRLVVTWDHRGFGRSTDVSDLSGPQVATGDLLAVLDALGVERADLVGQSMGGWTVAGAALARPGLVRSLVLADTLAGFTGPSIEAGMAGGPGEPLGSPDVLGRHPALGAAFSERDPQRAHLYQSLGQMGSADPSVIIPRLLAVTRDAGDARRLTMPVLCIAGDRDPLFPPASIRALAEMLPDARYVEIEGCGHSPYFEDGPAWNRAVEAFFATLGD